MSNKLPSVTSDIPRDLRTFLDRVRELISGTGTNRLVSVQDLITGGIAGPGSNGTITPPTTANIGTPPAPQNVTATGAIYNVLIEWDSPTYFGHDYSEIYGGSTNVIGDAVQLAFVPGVNYADPIGPSQSRYYWVRFVNTLGVKGPFNSVSGTLGTTGPEVQHLLDTLTGAITETELFSELGSRIDLVDTTNGGLINKYTVKIDNNGYVSGFGLASTSNTATPYSDFIIRADRFSIASPSGPGITPVIPFIVTTTTTTINGVTVNPGVYINGAFIQGGSIQGANIAGGTIENSKLINVSANKITGAALEATSFIESAAYIAGSQGWKIHANGTAEFAAASIRGQLIASQINANGLSIRDTSGNIILNAGSSEFVGNVTGTVSGTAASTVVSNASTALSTANTANATANSALSGLSTKLNSDARNVLAGSGGLAVGTLNWNSSGVRTSGSGIGLTANGLVAYNSSGDATFTLLGSTGAASFAGTLTVGSTPALSGTTMTGSGATINPSGTFALGNSTTNISYNGTQMTLNGNVVSIGNLLPGAALPNYVRTYKGSVSPTVNVGVLAANTAWGPLAMDANALNNKLGATDYDAYRTLFQPGTYFYELSVPVKNNTSDTNDATYTALVANPPGGSFGFLGYDDDGNPVYGDPYTVISTAGVNVVGDWQTATIFGVGRFTLASSTYISAAVMTTEANNMNVVAKTGFCTLIWRVWKAD